MYIYDIYIILRKQNVIFKHNICPVFLVRKND